MAIFKRGTWWWTDFSIDGQRYRLPLHTKDWREAQAKEKELISLVKQGKFAPANQQLAKLSFSEAAQRYLDSRKLELSGDSQKKERQLLVPPRRFFGPQPVGRISTEQLLAYREWRIGHGVGPATINMEMGVIRRILKRGKRWHVVGTDLKPLKERRRVGRAMSQDEKLRLLRISASKPDWQTARLAMLLALNTTMRGCELKSLRWGDIDLSGELLTVRKSKTDAGERVIPLNSTAYTAMLELRRRSQLRGGIDRDHYVFPSCENGYIDPTTPQKSWRTAWRQLTRAIECPACGRIQAPCKLCRNQECKADLHELKSPSAGLRFHDLRHHSITELAESQASDQTIMAIAGHVSPQMINHYSHVRLEAKRKALEAISETGLKEGYGSEAGSPQSRGTGEGYGTNHDTNGTTLVTIPGEMLEKNGRPEWTRTIDLFRVKEAL
jgi:integrase